MAVENELVIADEAEEGFFLAFFDLEVPADGQVDQALKQGRPMAPAVNVRTPAKFIYLNGLVFAEKLRFI